MKCTCMRCSFFFLSLSVFQLCFLPSHVCSSVARKKCRSLMHKVTLNSWKSIITTHPKGTTKLAINIRNWKMTMNFNYIPWANKIKWWSIPKTNINISWTLFRVWNLRTTKIVLEAYSFIKWLRQLNLCLEQYQTQLLTCVFGPYLLRIRNLPTPSWNYLLVRWCLVRKTSPFLL